MIEVIEVTKIFGKKTALDSVSMTVPNGAVTGFVGPNGAGKTTLMKIVAGLTPATSGDALVDGRPFSQAAQPSATLGICLSPERLPTRITGRALLEYAYRLQRVSPTRVGELLEWTGLLTVARRRIGTYSAGMRQRLAIGLALVSRPANLILDEPVNGLDVTGVKWLRDVLSAIAGQGTAILLSSHILSELTLIADTIVMLSQGKVVKEGSVSAMLRETEHCGVRIDSPDLDSVLQVLACHGIPVLSRSNGALLHTQSPTEVCRLAMAAGLVLSHLCVEQGSLEDVFIRSTETDIQESDRDEPARD